MTHEEKAKGNKLIAIFMGAECESPNTKYSNFFFDPLMADSPPTGLEKYHSNTLRYNDDWNWIMPVVVKIENTTKAHVCLYNKRCWIEGYGVGESCKFEYTGGNFIENVFNCIVAYITDLNHSKP